MGAWCAPYSGAYDVVTFNGGTVNAGVVVRVVTLGTVAYTLAWLFARFGG